MSAKFRVIDVRSGLENALELHVAKAKSPEEAARLAIGERLVRSGRQTDLRARVYFEQDGQPTTMVRLYRRVEDRK